MGLKDKLNGLMKIGNDDDEYDGYDDEDDYVEDNEPERNVNEDNKVKPFEKKVVAPAPQPKRRTLMNDSSVCIFKPKAFDEAREIAETLLEDKTVLMNFEGVDIAISQRVLDVITGACIAIGGNLQKISSYIFMATPASVDVTGEYQEAISGVFDSF